MNTTSIRAVTPSDAETLQFLASQCSPLDIHTAYTYWVLCAYFSKTCFLIEIDKIPIGFISAVINGDFLFLWQIGVLPHHRGKHYASMLLEKVYECANMLGVERTHVTIGSDNSESTNLITSFVERKQLQMNLVARLSDTLSATFMYDKEIHDENVYEIKKGEHVFE